MITTIQFKKLDDLFNYYNYHLFNNKLPYVIITLAKKNNSYGYFAPRRWVQSNEKVAHEISINPDYMDRPDIEWHSTLIHEMCHMYQEEFGTPSRAGYHNKEFSKIMENIGLITSDIGEEGGRRVGQKMAHYIAENGQFRIAFEGLMKNKDYILKEFYKPKSQLDEEDEDNGEQAERKIKTVNKNCKIKYTCSCGNNVWGKTGLLITCNKCRTVFEEAE